MPLDKLLITSTAWNEACCRVCFPDRHRLHSSRPRPLRDRLSREEAAGVVDSVVNVKERRNCVSVGGRDQTAGSFAATVRSGTMPAIDQQDLL